MNDDLRTKLIQFFYSTWGTIVTPVIVVAITSLFGFLTATVGVDIPPDQVKNNITSVSNLTSDLLQALVAVLFLKYVRNTGLTVQKASGVPKEDQDGWIGEETIAKVAENRTFVPRAPVEVKTSRKKMNQTDSPV